MRKIKITILGFVICVNVFAQDFHSEVKSVFNFFPHSMSKEEQKASFPILDKFFEKVIKEKNTYIEPLRDELKGNDNNPYFYFDGGMLLMEISKSASDLQLISDALVKTDLRDLPPQIYLSHLLNLSLKGANVIDAALHALDDSTFEVFIPQHNISLKYGEALKFILPRYSSDLYIKKLISKYGLINSVENKMTCFDLFIYANCCEADEFLISLRNDAKQPQKIRDRIEEVIKSNAVTKKKNEDNYLDIFERRKEVLKNLSDEVVYELDKLSFKMRKTYACDLK